MPAPNRAFRPRWATPPGGTIADALTRRGISVEGFARVLNQPVAEVRALLDGRRAITLALARDLERVIGGSVEFWMSRDYQYREDRARLGNETAEWLRRIPVGEIDRLGWLLRDPRVDEGTRLLQFFGVTSVPAWHRKYSELIRGAALRTSPSFASTVGALAAWLRRGEVEADAITCRPWSASGFRSSIPKLRGLTRLRQPHHFIARLQAESAEQGVAVVVTRAPAGCRASGATRFLSRDKALIQLSFRYLTDDQFWFTLFHEAGHLLLQEERLRGGDQLILEGTGDAKVPEEEEGADRFAERALFPENLLSALHSLPADTKSVIRFAVHAGVSPGIVVGQLQHRRRTYDQLNRLKRRYVWTDDPREREGTE